MDRYQSKLLLLLVCLFLNSCLVNKLDSGYSQINTEDNAISIVIKNYYNNTSRYIRKYNVFEVSKRLSSENYYVYSIYPNTNFFSIKGEYTLGSFPTDFPTKYKIYKEKLFLWNDTERPLENEILQIMDRYGVLDSVDYRYESGIYDEWESGNPERKLITLDGGLYSTYYIVCKNDVRKFKKKKSTGVFSITDLPLPDCDKTIHSR